MTSSLFGRNLWFTADLHLGHERIIELCDRPFSSVDEMNDALIENWNERVDEKDTVVVLGDVAMGPIDHTLSLIKRLHGTKILVAGNHDRCFHGYENNEVRPSKLATWRERYREAGFSSVVDGHAMLRRLGKPVMWPLRREFGGDVVATVALSHFPRTGESDPEREDRYERYRPRRPKPANSGPWVIHGHVHNLWTIHERQINVGVDVWDYAPVSATTLLSMIEEGMPPCPCEGNGEGSKTIPMPVGDTHPMGAPGCLINGGPE